MDLKLDGNFFRVDCNERGFTPANVEAICRAHASTKRGADSGLEYIGEKGIGFKSVFQAATTVWVSSRHYSFKFDKTRRLGKIAPIWERLPVPPKPGCTTFLLQLDETYNIATLRWELEQLDSRLLIFLRKLKRINISITEGDAEETTKVLTRCDIKNDVGSIVRLGEDAQMLDYIVISYVVTDLPDVEKRSGVTCSTILLAFPVTEEGQPSIVNQKVYSFLPIRDFGLRVSYYYLCSMIADVSSFFSTQTSCSRRVEKTSTTLPAGAKGCEKAASTHSSVRSNACTTHPFDSLGFDIYRPSLHREISSMTSPKCFMTGSLAPKYWRIAKACC